MAKDIHVEPTNLDGEWNEHADRDEEEGAIAGLVVGDGNGEKHDEAGDREEEGYDAEEETVAENVAEVGADHCCDERSGPRYFDLEP